MAVEFTSHNIRLDNGELTRPSEPVDMSHNPVLLAAGRLLDTVFGPDKRGTRIADLGCLEGGYATEFARMGFDSVGIEVREANLAACQYVKDHTDLPNLSFIGDDAWNLAQHGPFDAVFCSGLLYHIDDPKRFLQMLASTTTRVLILQTHFAVEDEPLSAARTAKWGRKRPAAPAPKEHDYQLGPLTEHEGLRGRWFTEFGSEADFERRDELRWASWDNHRSFWIQREYLVDAIRQVGFDLVLEQFDFLDPDIADGMLRGYYREHRRGMFVGVKTGASAAAG